MIRLLLKAILHATLKILFIIVVSITGLLYFFGETTIGLQTLIQIITPFIPGKLHIEHAKGKLFSHFSLDTISYQHTTSNVVIEKFQLDWHPWLLLQHRLQIENADIAHAKIDLSTTAKQTHATTFSLEKLALLEFITAKHITIQDVSISRDTKSLIQFQTINVEKNTPDSTVFSIQMLGGELNGHLNLRWTPSLTWAVILSGNHFNPGIQWREWPGEMHFSFNSHGQLSRLPSATFELQQLTGTLRHYPIHGEMRLQMQNNQLSIQKAFINIADASGAITGNMTDQWNLQWNLAIPRLSTVLPNSTGSIHSNGKISGPKTTPAIHATIQAEQLTYAEQKIRQLVGNIDLTMKLNTPSSLNITAEDITFHQHTLKKIDFTITGKTNLNNNNLLSRFEIAIAKKPYLHLTLSLPKTINTKNYLTEPIFALAQINFPDFSTLKDYLPDIENPQGTLQGALRLNGNLTHPTINGEVKLSNGNFRIPKLGIQIQNANLRLLGDQTRHMTYTGSFHLGEGSAVLDGSTNLAQPNFPTEIRLHGNNLTMVDLPEYKIFVSPDLKLHLTKLNLQIDGKLTIPKAEITPKDFRQTVTLPDDVVIVGAPPTTANTLLSAMPSMQVTVALNDHVFIHYQDLTTTLGGTLRVNTGPNSPATATGELYAIGGTYHAYGQDLTITEGRLIYTGGILNNPGLNIKAVREIKTVSTVSSGLLQAYAGNQLLTVGIQILGTISNPAITLFSQPAGLGQDDILSYLLLGIPRSQASLKDSLAILNATSALNVGNSATSKLTSFTKKLQSGLGLTELNVESVQTFDPTANKNAGGVVGTTSLVLGKKIADNLYLHYSVSLFSTTPVTILNLRYQFSKHWSIQSETSTIDNGADILYSLERD